MDLLQSVRKEGSRGGRADFKWDDVKADSQRENYLGHSLMAPVGRWQKGRDLNWYAKGDDASKEAEAAKLAEEKRKIKEVEEDAMLVALGLPVPQRVSTNANMEPLGEKASEADVKKAMDHVKTEDDGEEVKGLGFGGYNGREGGAEAEVELSKGYGLDAGGPRARQQRRDHPDKDRGPRDRRRDRKDGDRERHRRRHSRSRSRDHHRRRRSRSRSQDRDRERRRHRSRSHDRRMKDDGHHARRGRDPDPAQSRSRSKDRMRDKDRRHRRSRSPYDKDMRPRRSWSPYDRADSYRRR